MRQFKNVVAIDWSGEAVARPKGIAVAHCGMGNAAPALLRPKGGWSRPAILDWLVQHAEAKTDLLIGLDLSPALPFIDEGAYFPGLTTSPADAKALWEAVDLAAIDEPHLSASSFALRKGYAPHFRVQRGRETICGAQFRPGQGRMRRVEDRWNELGNGYAASCFNLIGKAQVGKSSLTGMRVLHRVAGRIPVWPFDPIPAEGPLIVEIYTTIAARAAGLRKGISKIRDADGLDSALDKLGSSPHAPLSRYDDHSTDAILSAAWLRIAHLDSRHWQPIEMSPLIARTEGWTFGVL